MSDLKLFRFEKGRAREVTGGTVALEKSLQQDIELNMDVIFDVRFLASEFSTGPKHGGRIDSLGLDENGSPVIFEYKRSMNQNVINQGLFYLDWLLDHRGDFTVLVQKQLGPAAAAEIDWGAPRLVCVASDFTKYDEHAIAQMGRPIELVRYRDFPDGLLALDLVASAGPGTTPGQEFTRTKNLGKSGASKQGAEVAELLEKAPSGLKSLYADLDTHLMSLGDDATMTARKYYFAYKRLKNFACVEVHPVTGTLLAYVKVDPDSVRLENGFTRDVRGIGHFGTGDLEITLRTTEDLEKAAHLLQSSYSAS